MPTYLLHGFRWQRSNIRIHVILNDLEDATSEWIIAPPTSVTLLNSFYTLFDFLPPSNPPPASYTNKISAPAEDVAVKADGEEPADEKDSGARMLSKLQKHSISSLRNLNRSRRPDALKLSGTHGPKTAGSSDEGPGHTRPMLSTSPSTSTATTKDSRGTKEVKREAKFNDWSAVKLMEAFDPEDLSAANHPHAYVADYMVEVKVGASIAQEMKDYEYRQQREESPLTPRSMEDPLSPGLSARQIRRKSRRFGWFEKLRDNLQKGEEIGWHVVVCGDEERVVPTILRKGESDEESDCDAASKSPRSAGLRGFFTKKSAPLSNDVTTS